MTMMCHNGMARSVPGIAKTAYRCALETDGPGVDTPIDFHRSATTTGYPNGAQKELAVVPTPLLERKWPGTHSPMASGVGHVGCHLTYIILPKGWDNITCIHLLPQLLMRGYFSLSGCAFTL
uniref:Uncharacterized protein n=1 Tax=Eutreptiella gymnastica TaxID=73025 RepID=A0A7S1NJ95_9EUGL